MQKYDDCFVGLPLSEGVGGIFLNNLRFAISSQSDKKEAAWEFVRSILNSENQQAAQYFPVVQKELDVQINTALTEQFITKGGMIVKLNKTDEVMLRHLIEQTKTLACDDDVVWDIIHEEASMYFVGDRTVEETARVIQSRLNIYVSEQKKFE